MKPISKSARRPSASLAGGQPIPSAENPSTVDLPAPSTALAALTLAQYPSLSPAALELDSVTSNAAASEGIRMPVPDYFDPAPDSPLNEGHHTPTLPDNPSEEPLDPTTVPSVGTPPRTSLGTATPNTTRSGKMFRTIPH